MEGMVVTNTNVPKTRGRHLKVEKIGYKILSKNIIGKAIFFSCLIALVMDNFSNIKISYHYYFFHFFGTYLTSFLFLLLTTKHKYYLLMIGVAPIIFSSYNFINIDQSIGFRKNISNSKYEIIVHMDNYQVRKRYLFVEKVVAEKKSNIFSNSNSKLGVIHPSEFKVKLIDDTKSLITIEINTIRNGKTVERIKKEQFFSVGS